MANRYQNGKIYKIVNNVDEQIYIGSTCLTLPKRIYHHKSKAKKSVTVPVYKYLGDIGWENVDIILIEDYPCASKRELERRERYWIDELKPALNKLRPAAIEEAGGINLYHRQHHLKNIDKIKKYKREKHVCICGGKYTHDHTKRHYRSHKHIQWKNNERLWLTAQEKAIEQDIKEIETMKTLFL